jgi:hypothetical protein
MMRGMLYAIACRIKEQNLLVALAIARILVQKVRRSCLSLRLDDSEPQLLGFDSLARLA